MKQLLFPTPLHARAATAAADFFAGKAGTDTVLLTNSIARGTATPDSDLDMAVLVSASATPAEIASLETTWLHYLETDARLLEFRNSSPYAHVHLDVIDGNFTCVVWETGAVGDYFEIEIGNRLLYSQPMGGEGPHFKALQQQWLPYYAPALRAERLVMVRNACLYELSRVPVLVKRGLHFHALDTLFRAFQLFLQSLFIRHKTYPIAYNKWIREQVAGILNLPDLYARLPAIVSVSRLESEELNENAQELHRLLEQYC